MRGDEAGFTLIEVLVAMSILGMSIVLIFSLFSQGLRALQIDQAYSEAVILAKSKLDEADLLSSLEPGVEEGDHSGGLSWSREIQEVADPSPFALERRTRKFRVRVEVAWKSGLSERKVALETLRTTLKPEWQRTSFQ